MRNLKKKEIVQVSGAQKLFEFLGARGLTNISSKERPEGRFYHVDINNGECDECYCGTDICWGCPYE